MAKAKTKAPDWKPGDWRPGCEYFNAANDPFSCAGVVTKGVWLKHRFNDDSREVILLYSCEAHAYEFARERGFVRMEPFKRLPTDPKWPTK